METRKWIVRAGSLLVMLGFVLPTVVVSCSGLPAASQSFSLMQLSSQAGLPFLYLIPAGALAVLILAFIPASTGVSSKTIFWGQVAGVAAGLLSIVISLISIQSQLNQIGFNLSPDIGLFLLIGGYVLIGVGLAPQLSDRNRQPDEIYPIQQQEYFVPVDPSPPKYREPMPAPAGQAWLQVVRGNLPQSNVALFDKFTIGRESRNDLQLADGTVSRQHAQFRCYQGSWFIQDRESKLGTVVNGTRVTAGQLNSGDQIEIGEQLFVFYCN